MPKGRKKGDGLGRFGGRQKGTPNKSNTLKDMLHRHSENYIKPTIPVGDVDIADENAKAHFMMMYSDEDMVSQFEVDLFLMKPTDRVNAELSMLKYHTPQMQSVSSDLTIREANTTITTRLTRIVNDEDIPADDK